MKPAFNIINISPKYSAIWKYGFNVHKVLSKDKFFSTKFDVKFVDLWTEEKVSHNNIIRALQLIKGIKLKTTSQDINLYTMPLLTKTMLKNKSQKNIMIIHDLYSLFDKDDFKIKMLCKYLYSKIKFSDIIITDSKFSTKEYCDYYGINALGGNKVPTHIYLGIDDIYFNKSKITKAKKLTFMSVGRDEPRKNLNFMIELLKKFNEKGIDFDLIRVGNFSKINQALIKKYALVSKITIKNNISETDLVNLYSKSHFLLFPSLTEGFGLPPLEAMSRECIPLIYKKGGSLPEVVVLKELQLELDLDVWFNKINYIYSHPSYMKKLSLDCQTNAKKFKWENYAKDLKRQLWQM